MMCYVVSVDVLEVHEKSIDVIIYINQDFVIYALNITDAWDFELI